MIKTISKLKAMYNTFSKSEKKIADFIINNPQRIIPLYITALADECETSEATIVRFARKIGFEGYQGLKLSIASDSELKPINENIKESDTAFEIFEKVCEDIYSSLEKTKKSINKEQLQKCCEILSRADNILIFGLGNSASVAIDAAHKMFRLGLNAHAYTDNHMQAIAATHKSENGVVIGISHSGHSKDIIESMKIAKENGATTIAITQNNKSPINKISDYSLETVSDETNYRILGLNSRIAQLAIIDTIYSYLVCHLENATDNIKSVESVLTLKKTNTENTYSHHHRTEK